MKNQEIKNDEKSSKTWREILEGGVPGILLGVGGTFAAENLFAKETGETSVKQIPVAQTPTDEMSFSEAFKAARAEVGPGGAFCWHGKIFSTYRSDDPEWIAMGPDGQAAHCHQIVTQVHAQPYSEPAPTPATPPQNPHESNEPHEPNKPNEPNVPHEPNKPNEPEPIESDVHITEIREDPDSGAVAAYGEVDGVTTVFVDEDGDGTVDVVLHDDNGDGKLEENEVYSAEGTGITIGELAQTIDHGQDVDLIEDQPDYSNEVPETDYDNTANVEGF